MHSRGGEPETLAYPRQKIESDGADMHKIHTKIGWDRPNREYKSKTLTRHTKHTFQTRCVWKLPFEKQQLWGFTGFLKKNMGCKENPLKIDNLFSIHGSNIIWANQLGHRHRWDSIEPKTKTDGVLVSVEGLGEIGIRKKKQINTQKNFYFSFLNS